MPHRSKVASVNQKVSPSQAEIVPQPPPHVSKLYVFEQLSSLMLNYHFNKTLVCYIIYLLYSGPFNE